VELDYRSSRAQVSAAHDYLREYLLKNDPLLEATPFVVQQNPATQTSDRPGEDGE
jgi:hypothetical protein